MNAIGRSCPGSPSLALALSACGDDSSSGGAATGDDADSAGGGGDNISSLSGTLTGGGWSAGARPGRLDLRAPGEATGVTVDYDPVGSGTGRTNFLSKAYEFAGSTRRSATATSAGDSEVTPAMARCGGTAAIEVPVYVSPIAVIYNVNGIDDGLDAATVAHIFQGDITKWNQAITAPDGADLPDTTITPVHRSDDYKYDGEPHRLPVEGLGRRVDSPPTTPGRPTAARKTGHLGVVAAVKGGDGTIGYADFSQTNGITTVALKVGDDFDPPSGTVRPPWSRSRRWPTAATPTTMLDRPDADRRGQLAAAAHVLRDGVPELRRRQRRGAREGVPVLHGQRQRPAGRSDAGRLRAARRRPGQEGPGHRHHDRQLSTTTQLNR